MNALNDTVCHALKLICCGGQAHSTLHGFIHKIFISKEDIFFFTNPEQAQNPANVLIAGVKLKGDDFNLFLQRSGLLGFYEGTVN